MCFSYLIAKKPLHIFDKDLKDKLNEYQKYGNKVLISSDKELNDIITQEAQKENTLFGGYIDEMYR